MLASPDVFPHTDYGVTKAVQPHDPKRVLAIAETVMTRLRGNAPVAVAEWEPSMKCCDYYESPLGHMLLVGTDAALCGVHFTDKRH